MWSLPITRRLFRLGSRRVKQIVDHHDEARQLTATTRFSHHSGCTEVPSFSLRGVASDYLGGARRSQTLPATLAVAYLLTPPVDERGSPSGGRAGVGNTERSADLARFGAVAVAPRRSPCVALKLLQRGALGAAPRSSSPRGCGRAVPAHRPRTYSVYSAPLHREKPDRILPLTSHRCRGVAWVIRDADTGPDRSRGRDAARCSCAGDRRMVTPVMTAWANTNPLSES